MELKDFMDLKKLQQIQNCFSDATGLAAITVDRNGNYLTEGSSFTDFCMKYTRGSAEGNRRCVRCDNECSGTYFCHAGLMDFSVDIVVDGEKVGAMIGGQVLPDQPDEEAFRKTANELGIDPEKYIQALAKVPVSSEKKIRAAASLLEIIVNQLVNLEYFKFNNQKRLEVVKGDIEKSGNLIQQINENTGHLKGIAKKQTILSLNATIEAARSGEAGVGFAVVAKSMQDLSGQSAGIYNDIENSVSEITGLIKSMISVF
ncbi:MAG: PocR ligand-binding domain-containing protein [Lachnospiraceae bacterium]|nr:PocR ligand-binding domain-containing protein [Lachnospiraceae bacterium]MBO5146785.1 PocR ligand-binding domain-containing protein [Lachnospiraceae bacterium]